MSEFMPMHCCTETAVTHLVGLLARYGLTLARVADDTPIPGSYWGESEAGLIGQVIYARADTPVHSVLHEACHVLCMDARVAQRCTPMPVATTRGCGVFSADHPGRPYRPVGRRQSAPTWMPGAIPSGRLGARLVHPGCRRCARGWFDTGLTAKAASRPSRLRAV